MIDPQHPCTRDDGCLPCAFEFPMFCLVVTQLFTRSIIDMESPSLIRPPNERLQEIMFWNDLYDDGMPED